MSGGRARECPVGACGCKLRGGVRWGPWESAYGESGGISVEGARMARVRKLRGVASAEEAAAAKEGLHKSRNGAYTSERPPKSEGG